MTIAPFIDHVITPFNIDSTLEVQAKHERRCRHAHMSQRLTHEHGGKKYILKPSGSIYRLGRIVPPIRPQTRSLELAARHLPSITRGNWTH